ncbi:hypothetical protein GWI33_005453 [Rhynchophorus ferrugineus]|uniref:Uncharacterized protein n=1 Tax=Rhynchophorus ferrugineus TaxID=354439 RepID=A0A834IMY1_RHYFE|nr:hypothetical protein GWI33_005453 [Rhynchophorus ferrugineus]
MEPTSRPLRLHPPTLLSSDQIRNPHKKCFFYVTALKGDGVVDGGVRRGIGGRWRRVQSTNFNKDVARLGADITLFWAINKFVSSVARPTRAGILLEINGTGRFGIVPVGIFISALNFREHIAILASRKWLQIV